jgi:hypothetical protein
MKNELIEQKIKNLIKIEIHALLACKNAKIMEKLGWCDTKGIEITKEGEELAEYLEQSDYKSDKAMLRNITDALVKEGAINIIHADHSLN